ncbi:MAG: 50S ribosomal protein L25 [Thermodesulfobacteriota bacterium]
MLQVDMSASVRENFGKGAMRRLRVSGKTPAVLYGNDKDVVALQLETAPFLKSLFQISRKNAVVNLAIDGGDTRHVMMKEVQTDPVDDSLIHADFCEIDLQAPRRFSVNIEFSGKAKGEDVGGEVVIHGSKIVLEGLPLEVPDVVTVDVSDMDVRDTISFADVALPGNVKMISDATGLCVEVISAKAAAAAAAAEAAAMDAAEAAEEEAAAAVPEGEGEAEAEAPEEEAASEE